MLFYCLIPFPLLNPFKKHIVLIITTAPLSTHRDPVNWLSMALTLRGETRGRGDVMRAVLPCGGRKRTFEWWDNVWRERLISYQRAVWKWRYFSGLNFNYIWARHWGLNRGLGLVRANSWQHSSCYCSCVNCETKTILMEACRKMLRLKWGRSRVNTDQWK